MTPAHRESTEPARPTVRAATELGEHVGEIITKHIGKFITNNHELIVDSFAVNYANIRQQQAARQPLVAQHALVKCVRNRKEFSCYWRSGIC